MRQSDIETETQSHRERDRIGQINRRNTEKYREIQRNTEKYREI